MFGGGYYGGSFGGGDLGGSVFNDCISSLTDDFNDNSIDLAKWSVFGIDVSETNQQLELAIDAADTNYKGITSVVTKPMSDCGAFSHLKDAGNQSLTTLEAYPVHLQTDPDNQLFWLVTGNTIVAYYKVAGVATVAFSDSYVEATHQWFRIREAGGTTFWDTSADGLTWTNRFQIANLFTYDALETNLFAGTWAEEATPTTVIIDNFNVPSTNYAISGTLLLSGTVTPDTIHRSSITGTLLLSGSVAGFIQPILQTAGLKVYEYKIYAPNGDFLGRWDDVVTPFRFSQELNSAGAAIDITLARNSDSIVRSFTPLETDIPAPIQTDSGDEIAAEVNTTNSIGPGTNVDLNLDVKVYVFPESGGDIDGTLIFTGYISKYVSKYGSEENTVVTLLSYGAELDNWVLESSGDTRVPYTTDDPSDILKDVLNKFNAAGGIPSYDQGGTTVDATGTSVSYTFNVNTALEAVNKSLELAPTDWFWWYDMALNNVHFHARPTEPDHTFVLGKHILDLNLEKYIEDITNLVYFTGGEDPGNPGQNIFKKTQDSTSITNFRRGLQRITDNRVKLETSIDIIVGSLIERGKEPRYRSNIRISDRVYDIESIKLGQLVAFRNFGNFVDDVKMQVMRIDYQPEYVQLQLDTLLPSVPKRLEDIKRNLRQEETEENPDAPLV